MQRVELFVLFGTVCAVLITIALRRTRAGEHGGRSLQLLVGSVVGLTAAFIVLVLNVDLVPDRAETVLGPIAVIAITSALVLGTLLRVARR